jgi:hypothetical protein
MHKPESSPAAAITETPPVAAAEACAAAPSNVSNIEAIAPVAPARPFNHNGAIPNQPQGTRP